MAGLPQGYDLVQSCQIVQGRILNLVSGTDGELIPRVQVLKESVAYLVGQNAHFARAFQKALLETQSAMPDGHVAYARCVEIMACVQSACGF